MHIAFSVVKSIRWGGGIEKYTAELGSRLVPRGHDVTVYSMSNYGVGPTSYLGMRIVPCPTLPGKYTEKLSAGAAAAWKIGAVRDLDIVHQHSIAAGAFNWLAEIRGSHQSLLQMHGLEWRRTRWRWGTSFLVRGLEHLAMAQYRYATAVSKTQCRALARRYGIRAVYIPPGSDILPRVPCEAIRSEFGLGPGEYILFASRLVPEKGAHLLVDAFRRLKTDLRLVIAGDAPNEVRYVNSLRARAAGDPRILLTGMVEGRTLQELFSNCYAYVQPSVIEGLSIALLEAMSYGNCCLVSDIEENLEALGGCGLTFQSNSTESLRNRLKFLIEDGDAARSFGEAARERVRMNYSWDFVAEQTEELYYSMLTRRRPRKPVAVEQRGSRRARV